MKRWELSETRRSNASNQGIYVVHLYCDDISFHITSSQKERAFVTYLFESASGVWHATVRRQRLDFRDIVAD